MSTEKNTEEEVQAWLDQVHYGSCCSDETETCKVKVELNKKEPPKEDSQELNS